MKINRIKIENFKRIAKFEHDFTRKPTIIVGPNAIGKTSILDALRFGVGGALPKDAVSHGMDQAKVSVTVDDDLTIDRYIRGAKSTVEIMNRKATSKSALAITEESLGLDKKTFKASLSTEVIKSLKGADFSDFFLRHDKNKISVSEILKIMTDTQSSKKKKSVGYTETLPSFVEAEVLSLFPGGEASLEDIEHACDALKAKKKEAAALKADYENKSKDFGSVVKPEMSIKEIEDKIAEIVVVEKNIETAKKRMDEYRKALNLKKERDESIKTLNLRLATLPDIVPSPSDKKHLTESITNLQNLWLNTISSVNTLESIIKTLKKNKETLLENSCPLNKNLICKTDKSSIIEALDNDLSKMENQYVEMKKNENDLKNKVSAERAKLTSYENDEKLYNQRLSIQKEIETLKKVDMFMPEKPEILVYEDYSEEKKALQNLLSQANEFNKLEDANKNKLIWDNKYKLYDYLVEVFDKGGIIVTEYAKNTIKMMGLACRARVMNPKYGVIFEAKSGLVPKFDFGHGYFYYNSLSTGEKILASAILADLFCQYFGSEVMILDELNDLDATHLDELLKFVTDPDVEASYNNIILSTVSHESIMDVIKKYEVDCIDCEKL